LLYALNNLLRQNKKFSSSNKPAIACHVNDSGSVVVEVCRAFCCSVLTLVIVDAYAVILFLQFISAKAAQYICKLETCQFDDSTLIFVQIFEDQSESSSTFVNDLNELNLESVNASDEECDSKRLTKNSCVVLVCNVPPSLDKVISSS
jgi:hypothetical protein